MNSAPRFDVLIHNGKIADGTGNPWFYGDLALKGGTIARVAPRGCIDPKLAGEVVDASGHVVAPGFIDIQSHTLTAFFSNGRSYSKATQGVTTEIMGESSTPAPFGGRIDSPSHVRELKEWSERARTWTRFRPWLEAVEQRGVSVNIGSFVGGGTIREYACGWEQGAPTPGQIETMCRVVDECMRDGAFGVAPALIYPPSCYATTEELIEIAKVVAHHGGVYISHVRNESETLLEALRESVEIGRKSGCAIEVYHLKAAGRQHWALMPKAIELIDRARAEGIDITADMYPYTASGTGLSAMIPQWVSEGNKLYENLKDPAIRARVREEIGGPGSFSDRHADAILPVGLQKPEHKGYIGKRLDEIARLRNEDWRDTLIDLLIAEGQRIFTCYFSMSEENLKLQLAQPWIKISTDAGGEEPSTQPYPGHPRGFGTYPRVLGKYVRDEQVLGLEDAVRKMSGAVAQRLSLADRGLLCEGMKADVVVFNPDTIGDRATFTDSRQPSIGVRDVWVNGARVIKNAEHTGAKPGQIVDGPGRTGI